MGIKKNKWSSVNSKGVSPLLGSVLIIGLAIMLSALVYQFTFEESQQTIKNVEEAIQSSQPINFNIKDVKVIDFKQIRFLIESEHNKEIIGFKARIYGEKGVKTYLLDGVKPFETVALVTEYSYSEIGKVTKVDLIPTTEIEEKVYVHPISTETTIKINEELSEECKLDVNLNSIPDCVDDFDNDGCTRDIDYDDNIACNINSCLLNNGCDNTCRPISCLENEVCSNGQCVAAQQGGSNCVLTNAYWSKTDVVENDIVEIIVTANNCEGNVRLTYEEEDTFSPDDFINNSELGLPTNATLINGTAKVTWKVKWFMDEDGNGPNPELNFNASINPSMISNSSLTIQPAGFMELVNPSVNLITPVDNGALIPGNVNFRCDITDIIDVSNVSLYTNISGIFRKENFVNPHEYVADNDTIGLYHLNNDSFYQENPTKFVDFSIYSNNGSCSGIPTGCPSRANGLFSSAAIDYAQAGPPGDSIQILDKPELGNMDNLSVSVWVYPRSGGSGGVASIINKPNAFVLRIDAAGSGRSNFRVYNSLSQSVNVYSVPGSVPYNTWTHIVGVYNSTHIRIYINGIADSASAQITGKIRDSTDNLFIGNNDLSSATFDGLIEEVVIFNRSLDSSEVQDLYSRVNPVQLYSLNKTINVTSFSQYKWNCLAYDNINAAWALSNFTFRINTQGITNPYVTLLIPTNNSILNESIVNFSCSAYDYEGIKNITLEIYNKEFTNKINISKDVGEIANNESNMSLLLHLNNDSYYNENSTFVYDSSENGNNGIVTEASSINNGRINGGFMFDSINDIIEVNGSNSLNITNNKISIEAWFNVTQVRAGIISGENIGQCLTPYFTYNLETESTGAMGFQITTDTGRTGLFATNNYLINQWTHIVGVYNGTHMKLYINGKLNNTIAKSGSLGYLGSRFFVGKNQACNDYDFRGIIDEVAVFNKELSDNEIFEHYNLTKSRYTANFAVNLDGGKYEWNCLATDIYGYSNYSIFNHTLTINAKPNITSIFMGNDGNMYNCKNGCYISPNRHSNATNISMVVTLLDNDCSLTTHKVFVHLCLDLFNTTGESTGESMNSICNEITSNYTFELNNLSINGQIGGNYICNFTTPQLIGPSGQDYRGTPAFFIPPDNYQLYVNVTELNTNLNVGASKDLYWIYRTLMDSGYINEANNEVNTIQIGDGNIQLN